MFVVLGVVDVFEMVQIEYYVGLVFFNQFIQLVQVMLVVVLCEWIFEGYFVQLLFLYLQCGDVLSMFQYVGWVGFVVEYVVICLVVVCFVRGDQFDYVGVGVVCLDLSEVGFEVFVFFWWYQVIQVVFDYLVFFEIQ